MDGMNISAPADQPPTAAEAGNRYSRPWRKKGGFQGQLRVSLLDQIHEDHHHLPRQTCCEWLLTVQLKVRRRLWRLLLNLVDPGNLSMVAMVMVALTGIQMRFIAYEDSNAGCSTNGLTMLACYFLSAGLFGFLGGFTNWLAVAMLFTKVPLLYGSGVIPSRFREIRVRLRREMISSIFDSHHFSTYAQRHLNAVLSSADIPQKIAAFMSTPDVDAIIQKKLNRLRERPEGELLAAIGIQPDDKYTIKPVIIGAGAELAPAVLTAMASLGKSPVQLFRRELDTFITERVENLDQETVTNMLRQVLRPQLGWVVMWGSVFGMVTGIIVQAAGIAPQY